MKVLKKIVKVVVSVVLVVSIALLVCLNFKTVLAAHKNHAVLEAAKSVTDLTIPEGVQIVGLGEASHGSVEFQESKLDVLQILVEKYDYRAIAIEADFCDCLAANAYVQGGEGNARDIVNNFAFTIYHTQQMADLLEWMRAYNAGVDADERLRFYGFDMQNPEPGVPYLIGYLDAHDIRDCGTTNLKILADENRTEPLTEQNLNGIQAELTAIEKALESQDEDFDTICAGKVVENIRTAMEYYTMDGADMLNFRDASMAANVSWILDLEKEIGTGKVMLAGHNGHIGKCGQSAYYRTVMGGVLKEQYGDAYYSLGTDFFKGKSNIHVTGADKRKDFFVTTADPMAYQAKYVEDHRYYVDFATLDQATNEKVYDMVHKPMSTGSLGESFNEVCYLMHSAYRLNIEPSNLYDGMIFYYEVTATDPE